MREIAVLCSLVAASIAGEALAAADAYDDASDPVYSDGFAAGDNGGTGWGGAWFKQSGVNAVPTAIGSSTENGNGDDNGDGDIDTGGAAFLFAPTTSGQQQMRRNFSGTLAVDDRVSFDFDHEPIGIGGFASLELQAVSSIRFGFGWYGDLNSYAIVDAAGSPIFRIIDVPLSDEGIHVEFTLTGTNTYQADITPAGSETITEMGTLRGSGAIDRFRLTAQSDGSVRKSYFNAIGVNVVPEPAAALGGWVALAALVIAKGRQA
jgi:hypothetical protein